MGKRRNLTDSEAAELVEKLRAFRDESILPFLIQVSPASDAYWKADAVNTALLNWADELTGKKDTLLARLHSSPEIKR